MICVSVVGLLNCWHVCDLLVARVGIIQFSVLSGVHTVFWVELSLHLGFDAFCGLYCRVYAFWFS